MKGKALDNTPKIVLGIDVGYARTGWGIVKIGQSNPNGYTLVNYGCIETHQSKEFCDRIVELRQELKKIIKKYKPDIANVEQLFFFKNQKTAIKVSQARGVILITLKDNKIPIKEFTPLQVKQAMIGYGRADKKQIQEMVKMVLQMDHIPQPDDAADALALAMCK